MRAAHPVASNRLEPEREMLLFPAMTSPSTSRNEFESSVQALAEADPMIDTPNQSPGVW